METQQAGQALRQDDALDNKDVLRVSYMQRRQSSVFTAFDLNNAPELQQFPHDSHKSLLRLLAAGLVTRESTTKDGLEHFRAVRDPSASGE